MDFAELAYRRVDGGLKTRDYIAWADSLLMMGSEAPSIAELASCSWERDPDAREVEQLFCACVAELGLSLPLNWEEAFSLHVLSLCNRVALGAIEPQDCLGELLVLSNENDDPYILWIWIDLASDMSCSPKGIVCPGEGVVFNGVLDLSNIAECIRKTASQFIALYSPELPHNFPSVWCCNECGQVRDDPTNTEVISRTCPSCKSAFSLKNMRFFNNREEYVLTKKANAERSSNS